jgi:hypothetical protein
MKVALCFAGLPRYVMQTYDYWSKCLLDVYDPDVFVHTWCDTQDQSSLSMNIHSLYKPVSCVIESPRLMPTHIYKDRIWPHRTTPAGVLSQWYSVKQSQTLRKAHEQLKGVTYDVVVRARFDWYLAEVQLQQNQFWNIAHTPTLNGHRFKLRDQVLTGINDQFGYGSSATSDVVAGLFDAIPNLYQNEQVDFCSELFLKAHLQLQGVQVQEHKWNNGMVRWWGVNP